MKCFWLTIKHKWFVLLAGLFYVKKVPLWRLLIHDWTKFLPSELPHYNRQFFGDKSDPYGFAVAWVRHQNRHPHHWEFWIPRTLHNRLDSNLCANEPIDMPKWAIREMVADWVGASRAYGGSWPEKGNWPWLRNNFSKIRVTDTTREYLTIVLKESGVLDGPN